MGACSGVGRVHGRESGVLRCSFFGVEVTSSARADLCPYPYPYLCRDPSPCLDPNHAYPDPGNPVRGRNILGEVNDGAGRGCGVWMQEGVVLRAKKEVARVVRMVPCRLVLKGREKVTGAVGMVVA